MKGFYRGYFHIGKIGFKFAKINFSNANPFLTFMISCIMNVLERKRYRYYCLGKVYRQWGRKWEYVDYKPIFCPTYFTCGLFNIVKHLPNKITEEDFNNLAKSYKGEDSKKLSVNDKLDKMLWKETAYLVNDIKLDNFRKDEDGKMYCIDYGEFQCGNVYRQSVCLIDYK